MHEIDHFSPIFCCFSGVGTLLVWLMLGEAAVSGEGGSGMEKGLSAMVNGGCHSVSTGVRRRASTAVN